MSLQLGDNKYNMNLTVEEERRAEVFANIAYAFFSEIEKDRIVNRVFWNRIESKTFCKNNPEWVREQLNRLDEKRREKLAAFKKLAEKMNEK